jgi:hypothetical protein
MRISSRPYVRLCLVIAFGAGFVQLAQREGPARRPAQARAAPIILATVLDHEMPDQCVDDEAVRNLPEKQDKKILACG